MFTPEMKKDAQAFIAQERSFSTLVGLMGATIGEVKKKEVNAEQFALIVISIGAHLEHLIDTDTLEG